MLRLLSDSCDNGDGTIKEGYSKNRCYILLSAGVLGQWIANSIEEWCISGNQIHPLPQEPDNFLMPIPRCPMERLSATSVVSCVGVGVILFQQCRIHSAPGCGFSAAHDSGV